MFCLFLVLVAGAVVWYMGPTLAGIAVSSERRDNPYYLLQLLPAIAVQRASGAPSWRSQFVTLAADDQGRLWWQGGAVRVAEGSVLTDVAGVELIRFDSGAHLVQMLTSSAYRALAAALDAPVWHLGTAQPPQKLAADEATVVALYRADDEDAPSPLGTPGGSGWLALLPRYGGRVKWDSAIASIRGPGDWSRVLLMQFPNAAEAEAWLEDPATVTERAIANKQVHDMLVLLAQPSAVAERWNSRDVPNSSNSPRLGNVSAGISESSR